jgi:hypothetical protein
MVFLLPRPDRLRKSRPRYHSGQRRRFLPQSQPEMATTAQGEKVDLWFRATLGFRKIDGRWKITNEHSSVPFYMDGSFKAAVDLKP